MKDRFPMTVKGFKKLQIELEKLKKIERPRIIAAISEARSHGDLKENAEYHAVREEQGFCEKRITEIEEKLFKAEVIDITKIQNNQRIIFGSTFTIAAVKSKKELSYTIVGDHEADFKKNLISVSSPMARALIGKKVGETVRVSTPSGKIQYKIVSVKYGCD